MTAASRVGLVEPGSFPALDPDVFRAALGRFATGVAVVAARADGRVHAVTVNAFSSVSLDPPLVLICLQGGSRILRLLEVERPFAVSVLAAHQREVAQRLGRGGKRSEDPMAGVRWSAGPSGAPWIDGGVTYLDCTVEHLYSGGDHVIVVGRAHTAHVGSARPLIFADRAFTSLGRSTGGSHSLPERDIDAWPWI